MREIVPVLCAAVLLGFSGEAMQAASDAAGVFVSGVMPALFPMMVLCRLLPAQDTSIVRTVLFSFASGSPAAAQRVSMLDGISKRQRVMLLGMTGVMSPMFFTGTLAGWTGEPKTAWGMLFMHWLSALLTGGICCRFSDHSSPPAPHASAARPCRLTEANVQSAQALLAVCGAMMLFSIAAGVGKAGLMRLFPLWTAQHAKFLSVLHAMLETGGGAAAVISAWKRPPYALLAALCSFGGLSIWLQNLLFLDQCTRPAKLLLIRMLHGALCYGLCRGLLGFFQ